MTDEEKQIGRIRAVLSASEDVIAISKKHHNIANILLAKETAYDSILKIAEYKSISSAAKAMNCKSSSLIGSCCRNEYGRKTVNGYMWKYREGVVL